ncbi:hypothetical protein ACOSQ3_012267 [Xanthoceras sorbifolium]
MAAPIWISLPILASLSLVGLCSSHRHMGSDQAQNGPILDHSHHINLNKMYQPVLSNGVYNCDNDGNCMLIDEYCNPSNYVPNYPPMSPPCIPSGDEGIINDPSGPGGVRGLLPGPTGGFDKVQDGVGRLNYFSELLNVDTEQLRNLVIVLQDLGEAINKLASSASNMYGGNPGEGKYREEPSVDAKAPESG